MSETVQLKIRPAGELRRKLEIAAGENGLTINSEILKRLEESFDPLKSDLENRVERLERLVQYGRNCR